jgi:alkylation response protein AidB-like acyl-CoA dehydrogenase
MAKLKCTEVAKAVALEGLQMMGGAGYTVEYGMEMQVRRRWHLRSTVARTRFSARSSARASALVL